MTNHETGELDGLRHRIDEIDDDIIELVVERVRVAERVAAVKLEADRDLVDTDREADVTSHYAERFESAGLEAERGEALAAYLVETSLERETEIVHGRRNDTR